MDTPGKPISVPQESCLMNNDSLW